VNNFLSNVGYRFGWSPFGIFALAKNLSLHSETFPTLSAIAHNYKICNNNNNNYFFNKVSCIWYNRIIKGESEAKPVSFKNGRKIKKF